MSAFAGSPLLISLDRLAEQKLLAPADLKSPPAFPAQTVDYGPVSEWKMGLLHRAFQSFKERADATERAAFQTFVAANGAWLEDFALFMALKQAHGGKPWNAWEPELCAPGTLRPSRSRPPGWLMRWRSSSSSSTSSSRQWTALKQLRERARASRSSATCRSSSATTARTCGPTPICSTSMPRASRGGRRRAARLLQRDRPAVGQPALPLGRAWPSAATPGGSARIGVALLDGRHQRGSTTSAASRRIGTCRPGETTAINGHWIKGPGRDLFHAISKALGNLPIIAEDLGLITPDVDRAARRHAASRA